MGSKIAALQAGFMSDLNQRLRLGPQAPKKEEPTAEEEVEEVKEKAPLSDARKGRARGPQRRAPAKSSSPAPPAAEPEKPSLVFSQTISLFEIDPEEGEVILSGPSAEPEVKEVAKEEASSAAAEEVKQEPSRNAAAEAEEVEEIKETEEAKEEPSSGVAIEADKPEDSETREEENKDTKVEKQSLVTNTAGETILEETVKKPADGLRGLPVEPLSTEER